MAGHIIIATYLNIPFAGSAEIAVIGALLIGASLGFLWYNAYPAQIFMGDVGPWHWGQALLYGLMAKQELLLVISGGLFVVETAFSDAASICHLNVGKSEYLKWRRFIIILNFWLAGSQNYDSFWDYLFNFVLTCSFDAEVAIKKKERCMISTPLLNCLFRHYSSFLL